MKDLIKRVEREINKTPTGELRNLLCDVNIVLQSTPTVQPNSFYVVANNSEDGLDQITNGLKTYEEAIKYKNNDFCKKRFPNAFIVSTLK